MAIDLKRFKCLIFDLDDTLVHSARAYTEALAGVGIDEEGSAYQMARKEVKKNLGPGHVGARNRLLYFKRMLEIEGKFSSKLCLDLMTSYENALVANLLDQWLKLGREALLQQLVTRHTLAIISNENTRTQLLKMQVIDPLGRYFKWVCFSEDVGVEKPDTKIYEYFLRTSGLKPSECCMIGDSFSNDIKPANQLGMASLLTNEFIKDENAWSYVINKLDELKNM